MHVCMGGRGRVHMRVVPTKIRREHWILWIWSYRQW